MTETNAFSKTINNVISPTKSDADVKLALVAVLLDEQIDMSIHTTLSNNTFENCGRNIDVIMSTCRKVIDDLIAERGDLVQAVRTQVLIQIRIQKTFFNIF